MELALSFPWTPLVSRRRQRLPPLSGISKRVFGNKPGGNTECPLRLNDAGGIFDSAHKTVTRSEEFKMNQRYDFREIEKWRAEWEKNPINKEDDKPKF